MHDPKTIFFCKINEILDMYFSDKNQESIRVDFLCGHNFCKKCICVHNGATKTPAFGIPSLCADHYTTKLQLPSF